MSFAAARTALRAAAAPAFRPAARAARLESTRFYSSMHNNDPEVLEREKRRSLSRQPYQQSAPVDDAPGWNEQLATDAEANVKADRTSEPVENLVKRTVSYVKAKHSPEERVEAREAQVDRDEIDGPLRGAATGSVTIEKDVYEEEVDRVDGEWHRSTRESHNVVKGA